MRVNTTTANMKPIHIQVVHVGLSRGGCGMVSSKVAMIASLSLPESLRPDAVARRIFLVGVGARVVLGMSLAPELCPLRHLLHDDAVGGGGVGFFPDMPG